MKKNMESAFKHGINIFHLQSEMKALCEFTEIKYVVVEN